MSVLKDNNLDSPTISSGEEMNSDTGGEIEENLPIYEESISEKANHLINELIKLFPLLDS